MLNTALVHVPKGEHFVHSTRASQGGIELVYVVGCHDEDASLLYPDAID